MLWHHLLNSQGFSVYLCILCLVRKTSFAGWKCIKIILLVVSFFSRPMTDSFLTKWKSAPKSYIMSFYRYSPLLLVMWAEAQLSWVTSVNIRFLQKLHPSSSFNTPSGLDLYLFFFPERGSVVDWKPSDWAKSLKGVPKNEKQEGVDC